MQNTNIFKIMNMERPDLSPAVYNLLQDSLPTTASSESSFSILRRLLAKDRKFKVENVKKIASGNIFLKLLVCIKLSSTELLN